MTTPRYAIYFAPEAGSPLDAFGRGWLGTSSDERFSVPGITPRRKVAMTEGPRHYGMHCTLKPPFMLNDSSTREGLLAAAAVFARSLTPIEIPSLEVDVVGKFIALTPTSQSVALEMFAAKCVRSFEGFRRPMTAEQFAHYHRNRLTVHQEQMLEHWGYPYVMEEFAFHMTLTDPLPDERERKIVMEALKEIAAPVLGNAIPARELIVACEPEPSQPMAIIARFPFGRTS